MKKLEFKVKRTNSKTLIFALGAYMIRLLYFFRDFPILFCERDLLHVKEIQRVKHKECY